MELQSLINQRLHLWQEAKDFVNQHQNDKGLLDDEAYAQYESMEKEIANYSREIERKERERAMEHQLQQPTSQPLVDQPHSHLEGDQPLRASNRYKEGILRALRSNFRDISNELKEGTDGSGGYLVPEEYDVRLIDQLQEENIIRKLATSIQTSGLHKINIAATKPAALWVEEGGQLTFGDGSFDQISLDAHKLHVAIKVTEELLYDAAFDLEQYILKAFVQALSNAEEDAFLNGDGVNKPTGIFHETKGGQVGVTSKTNKITADEVVSLIYALKRPYRKNAAFILNDQTLAHLRTLKDGNGQYLWQPGLQEGEPDRLLGYAVYTSSFAPLAEKGKFAMAFGDFSYYNIGDRGTRSFQDLKELFAGNGMIGFLAKERVDGVLVRPEAVQLLKVGGAS